MKPGLWAGSLKLVIIQPTTFCNLDCDYCYLPDRQVKSKLSLDLIEPIFKKLYGCSFVDKGFTVVWHAGEPLAIPISFYETAFSKIDSLNESKYAISHSIQTNGTLLNQKWCDLIKKHNIKIGVSIDGPDFIHNAHRKTRTGLGTHAGTMRGISLLQSNEIDFSVITVLTEDSLDFPDEMFKFYVENGIRYVGFNVEEVEGANDSSSLEKAGTDKRYRAFMRKFYSLNKSKKAYLRVREFEQIGQAIAKNEYITVGQYTPYSIINIDVKGNFTTFSPELLSMKSDIYGDFVLGNVVDDTFESVCETDKFKQIHEDIQAGVELCKSTCEYFSLCGGGAPSNKYFENGSFRTSETMYCRLTKKSLIDMILEDIELSLGLR